MATLEEMKELIDYGHGVVKDKALTPEEVHAVMVHGLNAVVRSASEVHGEKLSLACLQEARRIFDASMVSPALNITHVMIVTWGTVLASYDMISGDNVADLEEKLKRKGRTMLPDAFKNKGAL